MDVVATVVSANVFTAPFSGERAAVIVVEALVGDAVVGQVVFGDIVRLEWRDDTGARTIDVSARRATWSFTSMFESITPARVPAELVPMLQRGATSFRERVVRCGDALRARWPGAGPHSASDIRLDEVLSRLG